MIDLKEKVLNLPLLPGVYIMKNSKNEVIYVGKAKALKNRVSQYFQNDSRHSPKTLKMISNIYDFDIIITGSEFEALVLENSLIKKYKPKYNILLKDGKGYPYIKADISMDFPEMSIVSKPQIDKAKYFGPYTGRRAAKRAIDTINEILKLKTCRKKFPRDIGKDRPCLNYHLGRCVAPCTGEISSEEYKKLFDEAVFLLEGNFNQLAEEIEKKMYAFSEQMQFEKAAEYRDKLKSIQRIDQKQKVVASGFSDMDFIAFHQGCVKSCIVVLHYISGNLLDKEFKIFDGVTQKDEGEVLGGFIKQYYSLRSSAPKQVFLSAQIEDPEAVCEFLTSVAERKVDVLVPQKGWKKDILRLAIKNAEEEILRIETASERRNRTLEMFGEMLGFSETPTVFEAYDISNFAGSSTVGSMVVFENGQPKKARYKRFKIQSVANGQDDYKATEEMLTRRIERYISGDESFSPLPSVFLMDGGLGHVNIAKKVLDKYNINIPVFGMVKDDKHRTRGLISTDGREFGISATPPVFALIGTVQEEVHRFAIEYHRKLRTKTSHASTLDRIEGVGKKRRNQLLRHFKSIQKIKNASAEELSQVVPKNVAENIIEFYKTQRELNQ